MATPRKPTQLRARATRERLLVAAARMFAQEGYERTAVGDIAEAVDCSKGAYYFHFSSKEAALLALVEEWRESTALRIDEARRGRRPPDRGLRAVLNALFALQGAGVPDPRLILEFWVLAARGPGVRRQVAAVDALWRRAIGRELDAITDRADGRAKSAVELVLTLYRGVVASAALGLPSPTGTIDAATTLLRQIERRESEQLEVRQELA